MQYIFILFYTPLIHKSIKSTIKTSMWFEDIVILIICVYVWIYKFQDLIIFLLRVRNLCIIKS